MVFFGKIWPMNTVILDDFILKMTLVHAKSIPWRSNQEWRSICADTINDYLTSIVGYCVEQQRPETNVDSISQILL